MDDQATTDRSRLTRRGVLSLAGATALAGCQSIVGGNDDSETIRAYDLPDVDPETVPTPVVPRSIPVDIAPAYLASGRDRIGELLGALPTPLGPDEIPNGHIRERLTGAADEATDRLDDARTARTALEALLALRHGREEARYAAAGWAMADEGLSASSLERDHRQVLASADEALRNHEYVGEDPVRAAVVHARVEDSLVQIVDHSDPRTHDQGALLTVAEWGSSLESARATLADARHVDEQFVDSLSDDVGTVEDVLTAAAEQLFGDVDARRGDLPPEPTPEEWGVAERVVDDLRRAVERGPAGVDEANGPASAVVEATDILAHDRGLAAVRDGLDEEELGSVESAEELRALRTTAYDELDSALEESAAEPLARTVVSDVSHRISSADWQLGRIDRDVAPDRLDDIVVDYHVAIAVARATPSACAQVVDALETA
jgi:hypothetical protein